MDKYKSRTPMFHAHYVQLNIEYSVRLLSCSKKYTAFCETITEQYDNRTGNTLKRASFIFKGIQYHFQFVVTVISFGCNYWCKIQPHETSAFNVQLWIHLAVLSVVLHYKRIMVRGFHLSRFYACC